MEENKQNKKLINKKITSFALTIFTLHSSAQIRDNMVRDTALYRKLYKYLDSRRESWLEDSTGKRIKYEDYMETSISARNLKTDSVIADKGLIGVYAFALSSPSEKPWLYINHGQKIEYLDLDDFKLVTVINRIMKFFKKHPEEFTLLEQLSTIQNVMVIVARNKAHEHWNL